ncbi:hypothetical protein KFE25_007154 [Diacronema lutheri]|uniref:Uncharacterized protein n=1 Tax=Diacronema lutheri TaxID=2081491 RepID=A0A8J5XTA9_DIALT|nr:hypothetical protein KFE25_007154 [Diacronema lutheri]
MLGAAGVRVMREAETPVMTPSLELEFLTTRPQLVWNQEAFYAELNQRLHDAGSELALVLQRSKERVAHSARPTHAGSRALHFNADPIDRTHVILHSSFHVLGGGKLRDN